MDGLVYDFYRNVYAPHYRQRLPRSCVRVGRRRRRCLPSAAFAPYGTRKASSLPSPRISSRTKAAAKMTGRLCCRLPLLLAYFSVWIRYVMSWSRKSKDCFNAKRSPNTPIAYGALRFRFSICSCNVTVSTASIYRDSNFIKAHSSVELCAGSTVRIRDSHLAKPRLSCV
jgi:hypothetical protein